jgi:hypothetical protein
VADGFVEQSFRRSTLLPWMMTADQRRHLLPGPRRVLAAAVLLVVLVVAILVGAHQWAAGPVTAAERTACAAVESRPPAPGSPGRLTVRPEMVSALAHSGNRALAVEAAPLSLAGQLPPATVRSAYQRALDTCRQLGLGAA